MAGGYDKFMVQVGVGTNRKLRRLPVAQRWAFLAGVLPLAAQSPLRGALLIADGEPVTADDIAEEATIALRDAKGALDALRRLGMLETDSDGVEWVHDWDDYNKDPKPSDSTDASRERKRKQRARSRDGHADVTRDTTTESRESHAPKGEGEEEVKASLRSASARKRAVDQDALPPDLPEQLVAVVDTATAKLIELWQQRGGHTPTRRGVALAVKRFPDRDHVAVLGELEQWSIAGIGKNRAIKDWSATFAKFLENANPGRPTHLRPVSDPGPSTDFSKYDRGMIGGQGA